MKHRRKFRLQNEKNGPGTLIYWVLAFCLASFFVWIVWRSGSVDEILPRKEAQFSSSQTNGVSGPKPLNTVEQTGSAIPPRPSTNAAHSPTTPPAVPPEPEFDNQGRKPVSNAFEAQLALDRLGFSPGSIDGTFGPQSRAALRAFQQAGKLPQTSELDARTRQALRISEPIIRSYAVSEADVAKLRKTGVSWTEKARQDRLDYESILEMVSELGHARPDFVRRLNAGVNLDLAAANWTIRIPATEPMAPATKGALIRIRLGDKILDVLDSTSVVIAHFPCSIARLVEKRPLGNLKVVSKVSHPNYKFNPHLFPEAPESKRGSGPFIIPAGPNNPVGVGWIGLDRAGYGIHGTANPESIGRTESRGCFRLANWNIERLLLMVWTGMPVTVEP